MQQTIEHLRLQLEKEKAEKKQAQSELDRLREKHESLKLATSD
jgi:hypothetical protein